jgi:hypothetical protein
MFEIGLSSSLLKFSAGPVVGPDPDIYPVVPTRVLSLPMTHVSLKDYDLRRCFISIFVCDAETPLPNDKVIINGVGRDAFTSKLKQMCRLSKKLRSVFRDVLSLITRHGRTVVKQSHLCPPLQGDLSALTAILVHSDRVPHENSDK